MIFGICVEQFTGNGRLNHMFKDIGAKLVVRYCLCMLRGNHHCINPDWPVIRIVFNCNLGFSIRTKVGKFAVLANLREPLAKLMRQQNRRRHQFRVFIARIPKHHSLVAGATGVHAHGDVAGLFINARDHGAGIRVKTVERVVVSNRCNHAAHQRLEIYVRFGGNFAGDDHQTGCSQRFTSHAAHGIFSQTRVKNRIRNLVGDLIRMSFGYRLGGKEVGVAG